MFYTVSNRLFVAVASQNFVTRPGSQFVQRGAGAVERTVESKLRDAISVKDFGADPTGATDSTAAIQKTLDYAGSLANSGVNFVGGATVLIPQGRYKLTSTLNVPSEISILGENIGTVIYRDTDYGSTFSGVNTNRNSVENLLVFSDSNSMTSGSHLYFDNSSAVRVNNCQFYNGFSQITFAGCGDASVSFCKLQHTAVMSSGATGILITRNSSGSVRGGHKLYGVGIEVGTSSTSYADYALKIEANDGLWGANCYFLGAGVAEIGVGSDTAGSYVSNTEIVGSMCDHNQGHGILLTGSYPIERFSFSGRISGLALGASGKHGLLIDGNAKDIQISGTIDGWKGSSIKVNNVAASNIIFNSLIIRRSLGSYVAGYPNVDLVACDGVNLCAMEIDGSEVGGAVNTETGISIGATASNVTISNVHTVGHSSAGGGLLVLDGATGVTVSNCFFDESTKITVGASTTKVYVSNCSNATNILHSISHNFGSINNGASATLLQTVTGASLGDFVRVTFDTFIEFLSVSAYVTSTNTICLVVTNNTGSPVDLPLITWSFEVIKNFNRA